MRCDRINDEEFGERAQLLVRNAPAQQPHSLGSSAMCDVGSQAFGRGRAS